MSLPRKLKNMNLFNEGQSYLGEIKTVVLPKLTRKMEDYRGGGMNAPIKVDMGMGDDGLVDIGLPDAHHAHAVLRNPRRIDQPGMDGEGASGGGQVAAVAAPVDEGLVDGDLAVKVVDVVVRLAAFRQDHALGGRRGGAAHAVDMRAVRIRATNHPHKQLVAGSARDLAALRQVLQAEEHALAGTATHVGGGNLDLGYVSHDEVLA